MGTTGEPRNRPDRLGHERSRSGLLSRPPATALEPATRWTALLLDPAAQIRRLAALMDDGLLSREEFDRAKRRTLRRWIVG